MKIEDTGQSRRATCCVIGCGPAGAMLGLMLAREGVDVLLLEKHADFLRDFRGDTLHPSTIEIMDELGLADGLLDLKHTKAPKIKARLPGRTVTVADLSRLKTRYPYITFMPQWDFLDYVTGKAERYPNFRLEMEAEAKELILEAGIVRGVRYETCDGPREARALLTVAADGRSSPFREQASLKMVRTSPPIDVLWFRLSRREGDPEDTFGYAGGGRFMVVINRGEYWQIAYVIRKGEYESVRDAGLDAFRRSVEETIPDLADRTGELQDWEAVKLLSVQANRLRRWYKPGLRSLLFYDGSLDAARLEGGWRDSLWFFGEGGRSEAAGLEDAVWTIGAYLASAAALGYLISLSRDLFERRKKPETGYVREPVTSDR